jgi:hypothetical protein
MRGLRALSSACLAAVLTALACGGGPPVPTATPTPAAATPTPAPTASPTAPTVASLDPSMTADELFADDTPAARLGLEVRSQESRQGAIVRDAHYVGADGSDVPAFLVVPAKGSPRAGILFLHWLGDDFSSRDEFVEEAVALAGQGVESLLITQHFPWSERPADVDHDRVAIGYQVRSIRRALTLLQAEAGTSKLAIAGHDYGCMYGILTASVENRVSAVACMTPDSTWVDWFATYFHVPDQADVAGYAQAMADLDPVTRIEQVRAPLLLQFGTSDFYVSREVVQALTAAAPGGTDIHSYATGHRLGQAARADRDAWLLKELGIGSR